MALCFLTGQNMLSQTARILPLPAEVASQIRSSIAISSLESVVLGLVENSLHGGARKIDVRLDFRHGSCTVEDDGCGILPQEFAEDGGLAKPYRKFSA